MADALARSLALLKKAREVTLPRALRKPPRRRPGAAGLAADLPVGPKPRPMAGGAAAALPIEEASRG